eukprot:scaffold179219_cov14-Tisochrysis_lutea.AAC.1
MQQQQQQQQQQKASRQHLLWPFNLHSSPAGTSCPAWPAAPAGSGPRWRAGPASSAQWTTCCAP